MSLQTMSDESERRWHFDKTINLSHIFVTLSIAGSLFAYANHMDRRVTMLEERMTNQQAATTVTNEAVKDLARDVKEELRGLRGDLMRILRDPPRPQ